MLISPEISKGPVNRFSRGSKAFSVATGAQRISVSQGSSIWR
jgi:hypothetical protein